MKKTALNMISTVSLVLALGLTGTTFAKAGGGESAGTTALNASINAELNKQYEARQARKRQAKEAASTNDKRKR